MQEWNVICGGRRIGTVFETREPLARCAALSKFGASDEEYAAMNADEKSAFGAVGIPPDAEFQVSPA